MGVGGDGGCGWVDLQVSQLQTKRANNNPAVTSVGKTEVSSKVLGRTVPASHLFTISWEVTFPIKLALIINDLKLINGRQLETTGRELASVSKRWMQGPVLPLTSFVNLGKGLKFFEAQLPNLPVEIVTRLSTIQGCWQGQREEWVWMWFVNQRVSPTHPLVTQHKNKYFSHF